MASSKSTCDQHLREALEQHGHRFTEQRAAVFRFLSSVDCHPTADEVLQGVREASPGISLATVYKSLETFVGCGLASKLSYSDGSARYDARTDPHHHARCLGCGQVMDLPVLVTDREISDLARQAPRFHVTGYRLELTGFCRACAPPGAR